MSAIMSMDSNVVLAMVLAYFAGMVVGVWAAWGRRPKGPSCAPTGRRLKPRSHRTRGCDEHKERMR